MKTSQLRGWIDGDCIVVFASKMRLECGGLNARITFEVFIQENGSYKN